MMRWGMKMKRSSYSDLELIKIFLSSALIVLYIIGFLYVLSDDSQFDVKKNNLELIDQFQSQEDYNGYDAIYLLFTVFSQGLFLFVSSMMFIDVIFKLLYPKTELEKQLRSKIKEAQRTLPEREAKYKIMKLRAEFKYKTSLEEIREWESKQK